MIQMLCTLIYFVLLDTFGCLEQLHVGKLYGYCHLYGVFRLDAQESEKVIGNE